jgi:proteic killer suppression protein/toxin YoeB
VEIEYANNAVSKYFMDFGLMGKKKGMDMAKAVKRRFDQLRAADTFLDFLSLGLGKPHQLTANLNGRYGISVTGNVRLIVRPVVERLDSASLGTCKTIIIEGVVDYHGTKIEWIIP